MNLFSQVKQQLKESAQTLSSQAEFVQVKVQLASSLDAVELLAWLKAQPLYPQFFWQQRENELILAACGAVVEFHSLSAAQAFSQAHQLQLVGGLQFDSTAHFILPRVQFAKEKGFLTACITLKQAEKADFARFLEYIDRTASFDVTEHCATSRVAICDFNRWTQNIQLAIRAIEQQHFNKVVLANATELTFTKAVDPYSLLAQSSEKNGACYHFFWAENAEIAFIGSTPERLYQRAGRALQTEALAGTVAVSGDEQENQKNADWLLHDLKNSYENWLVVEDIQENLVDLVCEMDVSSLQIKRLNLVQHLYRNILALLENNTQDNHCLAHLHPTAAVAGIPYQAAFDFIQQVEPFQRGWYAGTLGYLEPERAEFCVTIRSAQIAQNRVTIYAGAGIVEGSDPQAEWEEISRKAQSMLNLLGCAH